MAMTSEPSFAAGLLRLTESTPSKPSYAMDSRVTSDKNGSRALTPSGHSYSEQRIRAYWGSEHMTYFKEESREIYR